MPAENVTISLSWWKLDSQFDMLEAFTELGQTVDLRGSVGLFRVGPGADAPKEWRWQFSIGDSDVASVARFGDFVAAVGPVVEVLPRDVFVERYPGVTIPEV